MKTSNLGVGLNERVLGDVFRDHLIPDQSHDQSAQAMLVASHQVVESRFATSSELSDQLFIVTLFTQDAAR